MIFLTVDYGKKLNDLLGTAGKDGVMSEITETAENAGASFLRLSITVGLIVCAIALIIAGLYIRSSNAHTRDEGKSRIVAICIAAGAMSAIVAIILIVQDMAISVIGG